MSLPNPWICDSTDQTPVDKAGASIALCPQSEAPANQSCNLAETGKADPWQYEREPAGPSGQTSLKIRVRPDVSGMDRIAGVAPGPQDTQSPMATEVSQEASAVEQLELPKAADALGFYVSPPEYSDISDIHELFYWGRKLLENDNRFILDERKFLEDIEELPVFLRHGFGRLVSSPSTPGH